MRAIAVALALLLASGLAVSGTGRASAATVSFDASVNLHDPGLSFIPAGLLTFGAGVTGPTPAQVSDGDFVHITYTFGGEGISASDVTSTDTYVREAIVDTVNQTGTVSFLDKNGTAFLTSSLLSDSEGGVVGQFITVSTGPIVFYGIRWDGMVESITPATSSVFGSPELGVFGSDFAIVSTATTPIPATLPLLVSALGGLGFFGWRRRARG